MTDLHSSTPSAAATPTKLLTLRTPLMAFPLVSRRTGILRKRCIVHNASGAAIDASIRFDFAEHSWVQVVSTASHAFSPPRRPRNEPRRGAHGGGEPAAAAVGGELTIPPGESTIDLLVDTDNSNFPDGSFQGSIEIVPNQPASARTTTTGSLEPQLLSLSIEEIVELDDFNGYAAVDLGTNSATIAVYHLRRDAGRATTWNPGLDAGGDGRTTSGDVPDVPSAVLVRDLAGFRELTPNSCSVGREALAEYRDRPDCDPHALLTSTKRHLGRRRILAADLRGAAGYIAPEDVIYQLGRFVRQQCQNNPQIQARLPKLMVTYPPTWDQRQLDRWRSVFRRLGYRDDDLDLSLDEASAVGLFHIHRWTRDPDGRDRLLQDLLHSREEIHRDELVGERYTLRLVCFDFGGGTIDLAHVVAELELFGESLRVRLELQGSDSMAYGGDQVTLAVFRILKRRIAMALADPEQFAGNEPEASEIVPETAAPGLFLLPTGAAAAESSGTVEGDVDARAAAVVREAWARLGSAIAADALPSDLADAVDALFPTRFRPDPDAPLVLAAKRNFAWLWDRAESIKRELFHAAQRRSREIALSGDNATDVRMGFPLHQLPDEVAGRPASDHPAANAQVTVGIDEVYEAIGGPLREAVDRARRLVGSQRPDRIVLAGQSSWIPLVRQLFARPRSEGGLGLAPTKIEFDPEHAKTAVSRGACLLPVIREALVGLSVDVSDFRVALLRDIYYQSPMGRRRELFRAGPIRDLEWIEDDPDPQTFARYLTVFSGDDEQVLGQFDFGERGSALPSWGATAAKTVERLQLGSDELPSRDELERLRDVDASLHRRITDALALWPETELIAWIESGAEPGTADRPRYRYYLTRSRQLLAVRDTSDGGDAGKELFALNYEAVDDGLLPARLDPFAGVH